MHVVKSNTAVKINDTTLRDGEQSPSIIFTAAQKIQVVKHLVELGINDIEVGIAATLHREPDFLEYLCDNEDKSRFSSWCRAKTEDVDKALGLQFGTIHISVPVSDFQLCHMGRNQTWVIDQVEQCIQKCRGQCERISIGAQDATRSDPLFLNELIQLLNEYNVDRLRFSDTVGIGLPSQIATLSAHLRSKFTGSLEFHGHNDLGLATANCIAAVENGVNELSVTVNGIGERAGNASLEQVVVALQLGLSIDTGIRLPAIVPTCEKISRFTHAPIPPNSPITGSNVFTHESGIHCDGQIKHALMYQPFLPEKIGRTSKIVLGKHSGSSSLRAALLEMGIPVSNSTANIILSQLHEKSKTVDTTNVLQILSQI